MEKRNEEDMSLDNQIYNSDTSRTLWNCNADAWILLNESGGNYFRDFVTNPAFFSMLPDVQKKDGIDIGCGHGHNTRLLKGLCRNLVGLDYSDKLIDQANKMEQASPTGISFMHGDATKLDLPDEEFDFATAFMSLIDMYEYEKAFKEVFRVLKKGAFFQFSIIHPCFVDRDFTGRGLSWITDNEGAKVGKIITEYTGGNQARTIEWMVEGINEPAVQGKKFKTLLIKRTQSDWLNTMSKAGFIFEEMIEPKARKEDVAKEPALQGADIVPKFQIIRCVKPGS